jgi:hypothetical protein
VSRPPFIGQGREREDMNKLELPSMKELQNYHEDGSFVLSLMAFDGGGWPDIIGWFVTMKC